MIGGKDQPGREGVAMQVKGTMIIDYVKLVRTNPDKDWDRYLEAEDWEIINGQVLSSAWYPYGFFRRLGYAVFKEIAGADLEAVRFFGKINIKNTLKIYKGVLAPGDPVASAENFANLRRNFIKADADTRMVEHGDGWMKYKVTAPSGEKDAEGLEAFCYQIAGNLEGIVEDTGGKVISSEVSSTETEGEITVKWE
jgi:hypothetical protein